MHKSFGGFASTSLKKNQLSATTTVNEPVPHYAAWSMRSM